MTLFRVYLRVFIDGQIYNYVRYSSFGFLYNLNGHEKHAGEDSEDWEGC